MRRLVRAACPSRVQKTLDARQKKVDEGSKVASEWNSFRRLVAYRELKRCLAEGVGWRERCAYCSDSLAADVEHFWPKEKYPERSFRYENMFIVCATCNRKKSTLFPFSTDSLPLLINPFTDDPWDSLFFVPTSGILAARIVGVESSQPIYSAKGSATMKVLGEILNAEPVRKARQRSWKQLVDRLAELMGHRREASSLDEAFGDIDDFGLAEWLFYREGKEENVISAMRNGHPLRWEELRELPRQ